MKAVRKFPQGCFKEGPVFEVGDVLDVNKSK